MTNKLIIKENTVNRDKLYAIVDVILSLIAAITIFAWLYVALAVLT